MTRSHLWIKSGVRRKMECTRCAATMVLTTVEGRNDLKGLDLWVCRHCEPKKDGRWMADVEMDRRKV